MQPFGRHGGELFHCPQPDLEVLVDLRLVKSRSHAGELELAMQRLVGDAEQGAVGYAEAEAVGGDGGRFHVERDGA